ncbi:unnamed protein product [Coffea canephora]|uniref:Uncharacterized protein n=1 Tax=Coffea canephora TaxID=49390 RepID=A0A068V6K0_COFCA|nr:unnamed protein product [Coffea canephora]
MQNVNAINKCLYLFFSISKITVFPLYFHKHKTHAVDSDGKISSNADVDFYVDDDMIHVIESKPAKRYGDYFLRQIVKLEGVMTDVDRVKLE